MSEKRECPLCHGDLKKTDGVYITYNGLCKGCARTTYIVWRDLVELANTNDSENKKEAD